MRKFANVYIIFVIALFVMSMASYAIAQTVTDKQVSISWDAGSEADIQTYQLYVSSTGADDSYGPAGDPIPFNPNAPDAPATLTTNYTFVAPAGEVTTRWFKVTAIDTSGNESDPSDAVQVSVDQQPPSAPTGVRVEVLINVTQ